MKEQWIEDINAKMDGYEMDAPDISWSEVESEVAARRRHRIVAMWQKRIAVAASLLLVMAASTTLFFLKEEEATTSNAVAKLSSGTSDAAIANSKEEKRDETLDKADSHAMARMMKNRSESLAQKFQEISEAPLENSGNPLTASNNAQVTVENGEVPSQKSQTTKSTKNEKKKTSLDYPEEFSYKKPARQSHLLASAYYGNGFSVAGGSSSPFAPTTQQEPISSDYEGDRFLVASPDEEPIVTADHRHPIRIGLSVKYAINGNWGVETGLVYSYLRSDITEERHSYTVNSKQKVGYVGIPIAASYALAHTKQLHIYASAGVMVELPVMAESHETMASNGMATTTQERKLSKSAVQMSISGRLGAEYSLTHSIGIYLEPGVSYYFDNGSSIKTSYSDNPFNLNLNLGVRFTVK